MIRQLVVRNRSYRRFKEQTRISKQTLRDLVELARVSASAANLQTLRYWLVDHPDQRLFDCLKWANYLKDWDGPIPGERPSAYIVILAPRCCSKYSFIDTGIACQSILLGATEIGLGGCMLAAVDRDKAQEVLAIPKEWEIILVIALGEPGEEVVIDDIGPEGNIEYWRDERDRHHVPKLKLDELILN